MKRTDLAPRFQKLLRGIPYVTIATTCPDGTPWNTPVVGFFDGDMNLYWASWTENQHSRNIAHRSAVFVVVYDSSWPLGTGEALYLQMNAKKLTKRIEINAAKSFYLDRYGEDGSHEAFVGVCPRRIYKAAPVKIWSNTDGARGRHFVDMRSVIWWLTGRT